MTSNQIIPFSNKNKRWRADLFKSTNPNSDKNHCNNKKKGCSSRQTESERFSQFPVNYVGKTEHSALLEVCLFPQLVFPSREGTSFIRKPRDNHSDRQKKKPITKLGKLKRKTVKHEEKGEINPVQSRSKKYFPSNIHCLKIGGEGEIRFHLSLSSAGSGSSPGLAVSPPNCRRDNAPAPNPLARQAVVLLLTANKKQVFCLR